VEEGHVTPKDRLPLSLADEAYAALHARIVDCRLAPGSRVTEKQLAAELGIGLTPVRQALIRLHSEDLVLTLPRRGYQIVPLTIESVNDLFQVWRIIGPAIAEIAGQETAAQTCPQFIARFRAWSGTVGGGDVAAFLESAEESWMAMAEATGNRRLVAMYARLVGELRRVFTLILQDPGSASTLTALAEYEGWDTLADPTKLRVFTEQFIDTAHRAVLDILTSWPSVMQAEVIPPVSWFLH
jgi:DNA-binding GntR family transcriptional regulator